MSGCSQKNQTEKKSESQKGLQKDLYIEILIRRALGIILIISPLFDLFHAHLIPPDMVLFVQSHYVFDGFILVLGFILLQSGFTGINILEKILKKLNYKSESDEIARLYKINLQSFDEKKSFLQTLDLLDEAVLDLDGNGNLLKSTDAWSRICSEINLKGDHQCCYGESLLNYIYEEDWENIKHIFSHDERSPSIIIKQFRLITSSGENSNKWIEGRFLKISDSEIKCVVRDLFLENLNDGIEDENINTILTELPGRSAAFGKIEEAVKRAEQFKNVFSIVILDFDHFSEIEVQYGHKFSDSILTHAAKSIMANLKPSDVILRWGDDEFLLILSDFNYAEELKTHTMKLKKNLQIELNESFPSLRLSFSAGASIYSFDTISPEHLIRFARKSLSAAKVKQQGSIIYYDEIGGKQIKFISGRESNLDGRLSEAIENGKLTVFYQPVMDLVENKIVSVEAFARWNDSTYGWIEPSLFLRMAERDGLIMKLGIRIMEIACQDYRNHIPFDSSIKLSINLSTKQLNSASYVYQLNEIPDRYGIPKSNIEIEITEENGSLFTGVVSDSISLFNTLGYSIVLDDYGSLSTSLGSLMELPLQKLKIDGSLVKLAESKNAAGILKLLVKMGKEMNLHVVFEGIESESLRRLADISEADMIQGNYVLAPTPDFKKAMSAQIPVSVIQ